MSKIRGFELVEDWARKNTLEKIILPHRSTKYSAGYDFVLCKNIILESYESYVYWTDIKSYMLPDEFLKVFIRSSVAIKKRIILTNQTGVIDCVPAGTRISTPYGHKLVEEIFNSNKKEDVMSLNEFNFELEHDKCSDIWIVDNLNLIEIETDNGHKVKIPENKKIYSKKGWIKAKNLTLSDEILTI